MNFMVTYNAVNSWNNKVGFSKTLGHALCQAEYGLPYKSQFNKWRVQLLSCLTIIHGITMRRVKFILVKIILCPMFKLPLWLNVSCRTSLVISYLYKNGRWWDTPPFLQHHHVNFRPWDSKHCTTALSLMLSHCHDGIRVTSPRWVSI